MDDSDVQPLSFEELVEYASGELADAEAADITRRVATDSHAAATLRRLRDLIESIGALARETPPEGVVRGAVAAFGTRLTARLREVARQVVARLVFDTRDRLVVPGFRRVAGPYQLAYECTLGRADLLIQPAAARAAEPDAWKMRGQIASERDAAVGDVLIVSGDAPPRRVVPDERGMFEAVLPAGTYELVVELDGGERVMLARGVEIGDAG